MFYKTCINGKTVFKSDFINTEHFFTTRESIIKTKEPEYFDLVAQNKSDICKYLSINQNDLLYPSQTHTSNIEVADKNKKDYPDTDGLIVKDSDLAVFLNFADCTPVILYDDIQNIGAVIHAGWRGTAANISTKAVKKLENEFGCELKNISAAIGPAIGLCCYNVKEDVFSKLKSTVDDFDGLYEVRNEEIFVDLKNINARQLRECGVVKIDVSPFCTCCDNDMFFSYRKENATTNRHSAILKICN